MAPGGFYIWGTRIPFALPPAFLGSGACLPVLPLPSKILLSSNSAPPKRLHGTGGSRDLMLGWLKSTHQSRWLMGRLQLCLV